MEMTMNAIWTEKELAEKLGLPVTKTGRSIQLGNWIKGGLKYAEKSGRRYFFEADVVEYLMKRRNMDVPGTVIGEALVKRTSTQPNVARPKA